MNVFFYSVPVFSVLALIFAFYKASYVKNSEPGTDKMIEISDAIAEGANAFLVSEYKILVFFIIALFILNR